MRRISLHLALVAAALGFALSANSAHALIVTVGCVNTNLSCTLQELAAGGSIRVDGQRFDNWVVNNASSVPVDLSGIVVAGLDDQSTSPGLRYIAQGPLNTLGLDLIDLDLRFAVATIAGSTGIAGTSLQIDQFAFGADNVGGFIGISEDVFEANGVDLLGEQLAFIDSSSGSMILSDAIFFGSRASIVVATNIIVTGDDSGDTVSLGRFTQRFVQIPEPSTLLLILVGLTGLSLRRASELDSR